MQVIESKVTIQKARLDVWEPVLEAAVSYCSFPNTDFLLLLVSRMVKVQKKKRGLDHYRYINDTGVSKNLSLLINVYGETKHT